MEGIMQEDSSSSYSESAKYG